MADSIASDCEDNTVWEICEDKGFVYKRRRHRLISPEKNVLIESDSDQLKNQLKRKKICLLKIRENYRREFEEWENLYSSMIRVVSPLLESDFEVGESLISPLCPPSIEEVIVELEAQEAVFRTLSELCDCVDLFCEVQEDQLTQSLLDLPIWKSPKALMRSLCD